MAVSHWWFGFLIDQAEHDDLSPGFLAAAENAVTTPEAKAVLSSWMRRPSDFDEPGPGEQANDFIRAYNLSGFDEFAFRFVGGEGDCVRFLDDGHLFRFVTTRQVTPMSVVWQVLGPERALMLPGRMGNLLLSPADVPECHDQVSEAYAGLTIDVLFERALRYCAPSVFNEESLREAITFLPDGLRQARDAGKGFLSLARTEN
jgi:hypothetical protein